MRGSPRAIHDKRRCASSFQHKVRRRIAYGKPRRNTRDDIRNTTLRRDPVIVGCVITEDGDRREAIAARRAVPHKRHPVAAALRPDRPLDGSGALRARIMRRRAIELVTKLATEISTRILGHDALHHSPIAEGAATIDPLILILQDEDVTHRTVSTTDIVAASRRASALHNIVTSDDAGDRRRIVRDARGRVSRQRSS
jgi:hypothetical protein